MSRTRSLSLSLCLALFSACAPPAPEVLDDPPAVDDTGDVVEDPAEVSCPSFSGIDGLGASWSYQDVSTFGRPVDMTVEVTAFERTGGFVFATVETRTHQVLSGGVDYRTLEVEDVGCDAKGMWLLTAYFEYTMPDATEAMWRRSDYDPPKLLMPATLEVGTTWTTRDACVNRANYGASWSQDETVVFEVDEASTVSVPAGEFAALRLIEPIGHGRFGTWIAEGVGMVLFPDYVELVDHAATPGHGDDTDTGDPDPDPDPDGAACEGALPDDTWVVTGMAALNQEGDAGWVCPGGTVFANGAGGVYLVEDGGTLYLDAGAGVAFARAGAKVVVRGEGATVAHEAESDVVVSGADATVVSCGEVSVDTSAVRGTCG